MNAGKIAVVGAEFPIGTKKAFVTFYADGTADIIIDCNQWPQTGMVRVPMTQAQYTEWRNRERGDKNARLIQDIFPELVPEVREILVTGMTPAEWRALFGRAEYTKEELEKFGYEFEE